MKREKLDGWKRKPTARQLAARFPPGNPGRPKGVTTRLPHQVKLALVRAMELYGADGTGRGGLVGYFFRLCDKHPALIAGIVQKILPVDLHTTDETPEPNRQLTVEEAREALRARGISPEMMHFMADRWAAAADKQRDPMLPAPGNGPAGH
jgi:hypothetical protein